MEIKEHSTQFTCYGVSVHIRVLLILFYLSMQSLKLFKNLFYRCIDQKYIHLELLHPEFLRLAFKWGLKKNHIGLGSLSLEMFL